MCDYLTTIFLLHLFHRLLTPVGRREEKEKEETRKEKVQEKMAKRSSSGLPTFSRTVVLARRARALLPRADGIGYLSRVYEGSYYIGEKLVYLNSIFLGGGKVWSFILRFGKRLQPLYPLLPISEAKCLHL